MLTLTDEQQDIIAAAAQLEPGDVLKIEACAGSGKTFTLAEIAKSLPERRFLYLAFNKAVATDAKRKFPDNVEARTVHSLAYQWYKQHYPQQHLGIVAKYRIFDLMSVFEHENERTLAATLYWFNQFCNSDRSLEQCSDENVRTLFEAVEQGLIPPTHSFYFKLFQLNAEEPFKGYDYVLLDEAQDTNDVTMSLFSATCARRILVGDSHQSIYYWRGAVNALARFRTAEHLVKHLSYSFRCEQPVLDCANFFLQRYARDSRYVVPMKSKAEHSKGRTMAYIARTNGKLIELMDAVLSPSLSKSKLQKYGLTRRADDIFSAPLVFLDFIKGKRSFNGQYAWLNNFATVKDLKEYAVNCADPEVQSSLACAQRFGSKLRFLYNLADTLEYSKDPKYVFTTAHSAKGLEWDEVVVQDDFIDLDEAYSLMQNPPQDVEQEGDNQEEKLILTADEFEQELNLFYVAITRARRKFTDLSANKTTYSTKGVPPKYAEAKGD